MEEYFEDFESLERALRTRRPKWLTDEIYAKFCKDYRGVDIDCTVPQILKAIYADYVGVLQREDLRKN